MLGSSQLVIEGEAGRFVYTGDFNLEPSYTAEAAEVKRCDLVLMECTYGRPQYVFPPRAEVAGAMVGWARRALEDAGPGSSPGLLTPPRFAGLSNFRMLAHDGELAQALVNSLLFDIMTTSLHIVTGMGLAIVVTSVRSKIVRYGLYRLRRAVPDVGRRRRGDVELHPLR